MAIKPNGNHTIVKQEFLNSVVNKIGKQTFSDQAYLNPLKRLKREFIEGASDIEEIYVGRVSDTGYDVEGKTVLDRVKPSVFTQYHNNEVEHGYKVTIHDKMVRKGFLNNGVSQVADHIIQSMHNGVNIDEYNDVINTIKALCGAKQVSQTISVAPVVDEISAKKFCKEVKKIIPKMGEWNKLYSAKENFATPNNLMLFLDSDVDVEIQIEYLASLFNMTVAQLNETTKVIVPNLKTKLGDKQFALLCDYRCLLIHPTYYNVESIRNTRGKFTNYDLVNSLILSYTDWYQFIVFKENA